MSIQTTEFRSNISGTPKALLQWHGRPRAFGRLTPPWESARVVKREGGIEPGATAVIKTRLIGPIEGTWVARHEALEDLKDEDCGFADRQVKGPFAYWKHQHRFSPVIDDAGKCELLDHIEWKPPFGVFGRWFGAPVVRGKLTQMFAYRHETTRQDFARMQSIPPDPARIGSVAITGASGLVGSALSDFLDTQGYEVWRVGRSFSTQNDPSGIGGSVCWNSKTGALDWPKNTPPPGAIVHLAGANIAEGRWTAKRKKLLRESRVETTRRLCEELAKQDPKPHTLICASATGYYGSREDDDELDESSQAGSGFLPELAQEWEAAAEPAIQAGIRVVHLRFGMVVSGRGGALGKMLPIFKLGIGGRLGHGKHWMSWIAMDDLLDLIHWALIREQCEGAYNAVSPDPVKNSEWTQTLGHILKRPAMIPAPAFAMKLAFGEMAEEILLSGARVIPQRALNDGFSFRYPHLESALKRELGKI